MHTFTHTHTNTALELQKEAVDNSSQCFVTQHKHQQAPPKHFIEQHRPSPLPQYLVPNQMMGNVFSEASPSIQAQQQQHHHHNLRNPPLQLRQPPEGFFPQWQTQPLKKQHLMASTEAFTMDKYPSAEHVEAKHCPPIAPLGEAPLPLQEIRAGVMGSLVGLLPGRCPKIMDKYLPVRKKKREVRLAAVCVYIFLAFSRVITSSSPPSTPPFYTKQSTEKQRRALKEDLSGLTTEEKVERRKMRARMYNRLSRRRRKQLHGDLRSDVKRMRIYKDIVDDAPDMMCIISPDIQSQVLYINKAARRVLHTEPSRLLGSSFRDIVHAEDKTAFFKALTAVTIFKSARKVEAVRCRILTNYPGVFVSVRMTLAYGMQGLVCVLRHEDPLPAILRVSPDGRPCVM